MKAFVRGGGTIGKGEKGMLRCGRRVNVYEAGAGTSEGQEIGNADGMIARCMNKRK